MIFTREDLIANTFLNDESIDKILKNQENADKWDKLPIKYIDKLKEYEQIVKQLQYRKKHPQAFNYAQFEVWITDILKGGNGFPMPKFDD